MEIAVLGGGHGCYAAAADMAEAGHSVRFWRRDAAAFAPVLETGTVTVKDAKGKRAASIARPTTDLSQAVAGAELIVIPLPATAQAGLFAQLVPLLADGQVVFLPPGTFGSYALLKAMRDAGNTANVACAETGTLPWLCRKHGPAEVAISVRATRLPTGVMPAKDSERALAVIAEAFPSVEPIEDALSGALMNAGPIIHPPLILMNAGPLEHFDAWDIHNEGTQPSIRRVTTALDGERMAVREAFGYGAPHFPLADHYDDDRDEWMYGDSSHERLTDSGDWREHIVLTEHRYMLEDTKLGLAFLVSAGEYAGVPVPVARGLLALGSAICGEDFRQTGRTFETMGIAGLDRAALTALLRDGPAA
ncbi:MAG: NAD/NADP octopine/nopaline dehydrogenase family protein [Alphaproteobacteria bacterium]|nr:NAD/NADP octopine/nopaline dehydrogenase family protein [Alphaproteobacteria bacterium]